MSNAADLAIMPDLTAFGPPKTRPKDLHELVPHTDPILREIMPEFDFLAPPVNPIILAKWVADAMIWYEGFGLSANQIGLPYRCFAMRTNPVIVMFNPVIVDRSDKVWTDEEACLSFPGIGVKVERSQGIRVRYAEPNGNVETRVFSGITARVIQHEVDHLDGKYFTDGLTRLQLEMHLRKAKKRGFNKYSPHQFAKPKREEVQVQKPVAPAILPNVNYNPFTVKRSSK